ncbi:MAG TPA: squalene/phytoene synthase family protein [Thermoanaerobaculia bacterium]|nr:squalene/phytoene synthase family protein [Thermoanaerobaculia bacterium]
MSRPRDRAGAPPASLGAPRPSATEPPGRGGAPPSQGPSPGSSRPGLAGRGGVADRPAAGRAGPDGGAGVGAAGRAGQDRAAADGRAGTGRAAGADRTGRAGRDRSVPAASATAVEAGTTAAPEAACSPDELAHLLEKTSRTFALAIPLLPEPTRLQVGIAYLLFRIADTFEDAELWPRARKVAALAGFGQLLERSSGEEARRETALWLADPPCRDEGYQELLRKTPEVLGAFWQLDPVPRRLIATHTCRTVAGMGEFVGRGGADGSLELSDLDDLRHYCYVVAGIVGEMLTELFILRHRGGLAPLKRFLRRRAARFGEALQLVNIVKDSLADATYGRRYLPAGCDVGGVLALARRDLEVATRYALGLQSCAAPRGIVAFCALPIRLAVATLDLIEVRGPGAKLSRTEVLQILEALDHALDQGLPAV